MHQIVFIQPFNSNQLTKERGSCTTLAQELAVEFDLCVLDVHMDAS